jgi:hypothetical protein
VLPNSDLNKALAPFQAQKGTTVNLITTAYPNLTAATVMGELNEVRQGLTLAIVGAGRSN